MKVKHIVAVGLIGLMAADVSKAKEDKWPTGVSMSGLVQIEGRYARDYDEINTSNFVVDELGIAFEAQVYKWAKGMISFVYEEEATPLEIDQAFITLDNLEVTPFYLTMGQIYVPFGKFETQMISDPLTLEIGEARESALQLGFETGGVYGSIYTFNGATIDGGEDVIDHYGANLGFAQESERFSYDIGIGYISDMGDSDGLTDALGGDNVAQLVNYDYVAGLSAYLLLKAGPISFIGEYVTALDEFQTNHLAFNNRGAEPKAWNAEIAYTFYVAADKKSTFAVGYQGLDEGLTMGLPEKRYLSSLSVWIFDNTRLSLEYGFDEDYAKIEGGTGKDGHMATLQLAVEF